MTTWQDMSARERDAMVAEHVMNLEIIHRLWPCGYAPDGSGYEAVWVDEGDENSPWYMSRDAVYKVREPGVRPNELGRWCRPVPFYTTDLTAARIVEDEIERRRLQLVYIKRLIELLDIYDASLRSDQHDLSTYALWQLSRATSDQRCYAALKAVGVL